MLLSLFSHLLRRGVLGVMILEIENIIRSVGDIRKAVLSLEGKLKTANEVEDAAEIKNLAAQTEFMARALQYEITENDKKRQKRSETGQG